MQLNKIVNYIKKNRVSTTEVADALMKTGVLKKLRPISYSNSFHKVGKIKCVFAYNNSNYLVHDGIKTVNEGDIVIIFSENIVDRSIIGDLISKYVLLYKQAAAIVLMGNVRDLPKLIKEKYPIWCYGFNPIGCKNNFTGNFPKKKKAQIIKKFENGIAICDDTGVVVIEQKKVNSKTFENIKKLEKQEDDWYYYLDNKKWDTKRIVVDKEYKKLKR